MALVALAKTLFRVAARPLGKIGFDSAVGATDRVSDLASGAQVAEVIKDQALDLSTDIGSHGAAKVSAHVAHRAATPLLSKASALVAARAPHLVNATRFGAQAGAATSARNQLSASDVSAAATTWLDSVWAPYVVIGGAIGFSIAFGRLSGLGESKWGAAAITAASSFIGDALLAGREPGWGFQALLVAAFGGAISLLVSLTPLGRKAEQRAKSATAR